LFELLALQYFVTAVQGKTGGLASKVVAASHPSTGTLKARGSQFEASLGYIAGPCLQNTKTK
jgi:hypothetical protein